VLGATTVLSRGLRAWIDNGLHLHGHNRIIVDGGWRKLSGDDDARCSCWIRDVARPDEST
jgi:hypothetical protein